MKLPKSVNICGKMFSVVSDKDSDGGNVDMEKRIITVGTMNKDDILENFLHEVGEAILVTREFRYAREREEKDSADYRFIMNHEEWTLFGKDMSIALKNLKL